MAKKTASDTETKETLITLGNLAKELEVSPAKLKKVVTELGLEPDSKKGACAYYGAASVARIKKAL